MLSRRADRAFFAAAQAGQTEKNALLDAALDASFASSKAFASAVASGLTKQDMRSAAPLALAVRPDISGLWIYDAAHRLVSHSERGHLRDFIPPERDIRQAASSHFFLSHRGLPVEIYAEQSAGLSVVSARLWDRAYVDGLGRIPAVTAALLPVYSPRPAREGGSAYIYRTLAGPFGEPLYTLSAAFPVPSYIGGLMRPLAAFVLLLAALVAVCGFFYVRLVRKSFPAHAEAEPEVLRLAGEERLLKEEIAERKAAEVRLNSSLSLLQTLIDTIPSLVYYKNSAGIYLGVNRAFEAFTGKTRDELIGSSVYECLLRREAELVERNDKELLSRPLGAVQIFETRLTGMAGVARDLLFYKATYHDGTTGQKGLICVAVDITERKKAENELLRAKEVAEQASMYKTRFLADISHEIRTPMNAVIGFADVLSKTGLDENQAEFVRMIGESGKVLLGLIDNVLDISIIESGKLELEAIPFSPADVAHRAADMLGARAAEKKLELETDISPDDDIRLMGDPLRVGQIITNLLANSIKFTAKGHVRLEVSCLPRESDVLLRIVVSDTGRGIPSDKLNTIFTAFNQGDVSVKRLFGGAGLGLAIVNAFITKMQGRISVSSAEGGSTFTVELPMPVARNDGQRLRDISERTVRGLVGKSVLAGTRVLLAEDNDINRKLLVLILRGFGCEPDACADGAEAFEKLKQHRYGVVIADVKMPEMGGIELVRLMRGELKLDTPVLALSAAATHEDIRAAREAGINAYLTKPVEVDQLEKELIRCVKGYALAASQS